ncbi:MAG: hypothetical protein U9P00_05335, partial [Pseudomonadota bacterium]|nr:hypothetical protein [Pseudomonadota bacterium]
EIAKKFLTAGEYKQYLRRKAQGRTNFLLRLNGTVWRMPDGSLLDPEWLDNERSEHAFLETWKDELERRGIKFPEVP